MSSGSCVIPLTAGIINCKKNWPNQAITLASLENTYMHLLSFYLDTSHSKILKPQESFNCSIIICSFLRSGD